MQTSDFKPLSSRPDIEQYRKQAKELAKLLQAGDPAALQRLQTFHPNFKGQAALSDAQLVLAREHGLTSWPKFATFIEELRKSSSPTHQFESAVDAIVSGDLGGLAELLAAQPELISARSERVHRSTLIHYIGANGVEDYRQKTPLNAVDILRHLIRAGAEVDSIADIYGQSTPLSLVAASGHPVRAGVQIQLMEELIDAGADIDFGNPSVVQACLSNGRGMAAEFLAKRGAKLTLDAAAGVGDLERVQILYTSASDWQGVRGLKWAAEYGWLDVVQYLLDQGVDIADSSDGMTALHLAVIGGNLDAVKLLLDRGAPKEVVNRYGGTPLGQAYWCQENDRSGIDFKPVISLLEN